MKHLLFLAPFVLAACADSPLAKVPYKVTSVSGETLIENVVVPEGRCVRVSLTPVNDVTVGGGSSAVGVTLGETGSADIGSGCEAAE